MSGLTAVMPRQKQTALLAAEPRPWQRISLSCAREGDDVVDGEEIARVVELGDEREFVVEPLCDFVRNAVGISVFGIALLRARPGQILQMLLRGLARRHRLVGIFVFELAEREAAGFGDLDGAGDGVGKVGEQPRHLRRRLEMPLGIDAAASRLRRCVHFSRMQVSTSASGRRSGA